MDSHFITVHVIIFLMYTVIAFTREARYEVLGGKRISTYYYSKSEPCVENKTAKWK